ncbi:hypothetical protein B9Z51_16930 [Limnohabitans sp. T6-5]|uniref:PhaM family polyhydroxyalkanoate granule multifunctional regulatory protein n=1 Tax=Limnohabitans sp. T6-5 TaxID=1100724 RepID=UPI000D336903|nr:PhaM family polyhydroxyalkanoate granule multifunctional regulatory protein [Limnohabitans sp. T6-5]PUE06479.1 hypothetical protein B9Z51_16930 [Limnohabitans sp. T6-5]
MSDPNAFGFGQFVPGFDFLKNLTQSAAKAQPATGAMPGMASWVAPTLSVEEIDKRIQELKAVQFWLDQNATALKATIQAMEVQKMTLSTLQSMNVNMSDLAKAFTAKPPEAQASASPADAAPKPEFASAPKSSLFSPKPKADAEPAPSPDVAQAATPDGAAQAEAQSADAAAPSAVDPMQWWNALTQQFQTIASTALKDVAAEAMKAGLSDKESGVKQKSSAKAKSASPRSAKPAAAPSTETQATKSKVKSVSTTAAKKAPRKRPAAQRSPA